MVTPQGVGTLEQRPVDDQLALEDVLKALADPIRLEIVRRMVHDHEVPCTLLEKVLLVAKSTISYHIKVLHHADLLTVRREGRFYFYSLRGEVLESYLPGFTQLLLAREPGLADLPA